MNELLSTLLQLVPSLASHVFLPLLVLAFAFVVCKTIYRLLGVIKK